MALAPVYVFASDDPFLKNEKSTQIIAKARQEMPDAELMLFANDDFSSGATANLARLENELIDPGLFGGDRIIKIYLKDLNSTAVQVLHLLSRSYRTGVVCVVELPKIKKTLIPPKPEEYKDKLTGTVDTKAKHVFAFLNNIGAVIEVLYPPQGQELSRWIYERATQKYHFAISNDAVAFLSLSCEGNLVALDHFMQIIELSGQKEISVELAQSYLSSSSRYDGFEFAEAVIAADTRRALNILSSLCQTNTSSTTILSLVIQNFDRMLGTIAEARQELGKLSNFRDRKIFFNAHRIYLPSTMDCISKAARQMPPDFFEYLVSELKNASLAIQNFDEKKAYQCLQNMAVSVCVPQVRNLREL